MRHTDETLQLYITDSLEDLPVIESRLLALEQDCPDMDSELLDTLSRSIANIRRGADFTCFAAVRDLAHGLEKLLERLKTGAIALSPALMEGMFSGIESISLLFGDPRHFKEWEVAEQVSVLSGLGADGSLCSAPALLEDVSLQEKNPLADLVRSSGEDGEAPMEQLLPGSGKMPQTSIRVGVALLDNLMTLAGELVLSRNQLVQGVGGSNGPALEAASQRIDMITSELQEAIMQTRMQPIGGVFSKFNRVVRDMARDLNKSILLTIEGKEVELDKTILEAVGAPLAHLIRNAVEHGIEFPEVRKMAGKDQQGRIRLKAFHEAGQVNIEISDDGQGFDGDTLAMAAVSKGILTEEQVGAMGENEKMSIIFLPGFSTSNRVCGVSDMEGGMDMVKTTLDKLGGIIDINSEPGMGTEIRIRLPLTLAIIPSQIIAVGDERFAIPQVNLDELLRIPAAQVKDRIEKVGDAEVVRLRGNLLPILSLADILGVDRYYVDPADGQRHLDRRTAIADRRSVRRDISGQPEGSGEPVSLPQGNRSGTDRRLRAGSAINIAVVSAGPFKYGLVVDSLRDSEEIVVKPLGRHLKGCEGYAGATIMGDGRVALILDVASLARMASLSALTGSAGSASSAVDASGAEDSVKERTSLLLFRNLDHEQFAVPLSLVERTERFRSSDIENVGGRRVIQYRGGSLPVYELAEVVNVSPLPARVQREVIVFRVAGREVGLMVTPPVDAVEVDLVLDTNAFRQNGITGSIIAGGHTTPLVDILGLVKSLNPHWFDRCEHQSSLQDYNSSHLREEDFQTN